MEGYTQRKLKDGEVAVTSDKTGKTYDTKDPKKLERDHEVFEHIKKDDPNGMTPNKDVKKLEDEIVDDDVDDEHSQATIEMVEKENEALRKELESLRKELKGYKVDGMLEDVDEQFSPLFKRILANADDPEGLKKELLKENQAYKKPVDIKAIPDITPEQKASAPKNGDEAYMEYLKNKNK